MLGWAITFLIVAVCAAFLGFGDIAGTAISATKLIFIVALLLFAISMALRIIRRDAPRG